MVSHIKPTIIYDFDGTIADSIGAGVYIFNEIARECGYQEITPDNFQTLRHLGARKAIARLGVPFWKLPFIVRRGKKALALRVSELAPFPGIKAVISELSSLGIRQGLVTSNDLENVKSFLTHNGIALDFVRMSYKLFGKSGCLKEVMREMKLNPQHTYYIGDETRDIEAGRRVGFKVISVTWGANAKEALEALKPDHLVHAPSDILSLFKS